MPLNFNRQNGGQPNIMYRPNNNDFTVVNENVDNDENDENDEDIGSPIQSEASIPSLINTGDNRKEMIFKMQNQLRKSVGNKKTTPRTLYSNLIREMNKIKPNQTKFKNGNQFGIKISNTDQTNTGDTNYFNKDTVNQFEKTKNLKTIDCKPGKDCNKKYRKNFQICNDNKCVPEKYDELQQKVWSVTYSELFGLMLDGTINLQTESTYKQELFKMLKTDKYGEFENYIYMVLSIIFTDYQSHFVNYVVQVEENDTSNKLLEDLIVDVLQSKHWNYRFLSHYDQTKQLMDFHSFLIQFNTEQTRVYVYLTEYMLRYYQRYFQLNKTNFCNIAMIKIIIDGSFYLFRDDRKRMDNDIASKMVKLSKGEWEFIASSYYDHFTNFVSQNWNEKSKNLLDSKWKYHKIIPIIVDIIKDSASSFEFYKSYSEFSEATKQSFKKIKNTDNPVEYKYNNCVIGGFPINYIEKEYTNSVCELLGLLMTRNSTNSIFYSLNNLVLKMVLKKKKKEMKKSTKPIDQSTSYYNDIDKDKEDEYKEILENIDELIKSNNLSIDELNNYSLKHSFIDQEQYDANYIQSTINNNPKISLDQLNLLYNSVKKYYTIKSFIGTIEDLSYFNTFQQNYLKNKLQNIHNIGSIEQYLMSINPDLLDEKIENMQQSYDSFKSQYREKQNEEDQNVKATNHKKIVDYIERLKKRNDQYDKFNEYVKEKNGAVIAQYLNRFNNNSDDLDKQIKYIDDLFFNFLEKQSEQGGNESNV